MQPKEEPCILYIETATSVCSVAVSIGHQLVAHREIEDGHSHASQLIVLIDELLHASKITKEQLDAVAVSNGPGSYTGLRIGVSTAKGIAYSLQLPIIAISTLESIFYSAKSRHQAQRFIPMIDARRMEVYTQTFDNEGNTLDDIHAAILDEDYVNHLSTDLSIVLCGNGAAKAKELFSAYQQVMIDETSLSAASMLQPALKKYRLCQFEDIAYFEPFYLKDYIAAKPTVKGLI